MHIICVVSALLQARGDSGEEPCMASPRLSPRTAPALQEGGGGRSAGGVGGQQLEAYMMETGEGRAPPRKPHPNGDSHHGPLHGENLEMNRVPVRSRDTASPRLSSCTAPAPCGRRRSAKAGRGGGNTSLYGMEAGVFISKTELPGTRSFLLSAFTEVLEKRRNPPKSRGGGTPPSSLPRRSSGSPLL